MAIHIDHGTEESHSFALQKPALQKPCILGEEYPAAAAQHAMPGNSLHLSTAQRPGNLAR